MGDRLAHIQLYPVAACVASARIQYILSCRVGFRSLSPCWLARWKLVAAFVP